MNAIDTDRLKKAIELALARGDLSQAQLARRLGYKPDRFNKWLVGQNRIPFEVVGQVCDALGLSPQDQVHLYRLAGYPLPSWVTAPVAEGPTEPGGARHKPGLRQFSCSTDFYAYENERIRQARHTVCDLSWGIDLPNFSEDEDSIYQAYLDAMEGACARGVQYREVMTFENDPLHFLDRAERMLYPHRITYNLRYFDVDLLQIPPLMHVMLIDGEEVCFGLYRWPYLPVEGEIRLATQQQEIVNLFEDYFETIWLAARPIKDGDRFSDSEFLALKRRYLDDE